MSTSSLPSFMKIHQAVLEKKMKMWKFTDGRRTTDGRTDDGRTDDGRCAMTIAHLSLWLRWAKNDKPILVWTIRFTKFRKKGGKIILTFWYGGNSILAYFFRPAVTRGETLTWDGFFRGEILYGGIFYATTPGLQQALFYGHKVCAALIKLVSYLVSMIRGCK